MTALELLTAIGETEEEYGKTVFTPPAKRKLSRPLRTAIILAAVLALLALLAVAAKEAGFLERLLKERYEAVEDYVNHIAVTVENDGLRLTLHEAVTDGYTTLLVYSIERLDGVSIEQDWDQDAIIRPLTEDGLPARMGSGIREPLATSNAGQGDPCRWVYLWYNKGQTQMGRISFRLFGLVNRKTGERFTPGYLEAEAELKACLTKLGGRQGDPGAEKLYTNIVLSPFGLRADMLTNLAGMTPENAPEPEKWSLNKAFRGSLDFVLEEGEEQELVYDVGLLVDPYCQGVYVLNVAFRQPTDIRGIRAVRIDGVEYPLETGSLPRQRIGSMDPSASPLESARVWVYGDHEPAHPALTGEGTELTLSLDGVWTDGYTTEFLLCSRGGTAEPSVGPTVDLGGSFVFEALNAAGEPVAVGVRCGGAAEGLLPFVAECTEKATTLIVRCGDAELTIPLNMKQLKKLPQIAPQEPSKRDPGYAQRHGEEMQKMFSRLFADHDPAEVSYSADNGAYRISVDSLALRGSEGEGSLRAWVRCSALEGEYDLLLESTSAFSCSVLSEGRELQVSKAGYSADGTVDDEAGDRIFALKFDFAGDFGHMDALRLTWTPPAGDRITLDLEKTE